LKHVYKYLLALMLIQMVWIVDRLFDTARKGGGGEFRL